MRSKTLALFIATLALVVVPSGPAQAEEIVTDCDNLQEALSLSNPGDTVTLEEGEECHQHYDLPSHQITLQGAGSGATLSGDLGKGGTTQILRGHDVENTTIRNLTFQEGQTDGDGGAIYLTGDSSPTIENNNFFDNDAGRGGAVAIDVFAGPPVTPPQGPQGRGNGEVPVVLRDNTFGGDEDSNTADARGGAVYMVTGAPVHLFSNDFINNNTFDGSGGAAYIVLIGGLIVDDNVFEENTAQKRGGGMTARMCAGADPASVTNNLFDDNVIEQPELIFLREGRVETSDGPLGAGLHLTDECVFERASRGKNGPEFHVVQSGNDFVNNLIDARTVDNRPPGGGAGEAIQGLAVQSTNDYFFNNEVNRTGGEGGGLYVETHFGEPFEGRNLVAAANQVLSEPEEQVPARGFDGGEPSGAGGGIYFGRLDFPGELRVYDSTVVNNTAFDGSGIEGDSCDGLTLYNSIVYGNTGHHVESGEIAGFNGGAEECAPNNNVRAAPGTRDVQFTDTCAPGDSGVTPHEGTGNICADPLLVNPGGGDIKQTSGSPTRDKGSNGLVPGDLSGDFFGAARISNGTVDMGAHEFQVTPPVVPTPAAAGGCLNSQGGVTGRRLGPVLLGRRRAAQREAMLGARLLTRLGLDKYCVTGGGLFRIGYPTARINRTIGRSLRRAVADRVVLALTSSPRFNVSGIVPSQTSEATARRRLRGERRFRIGKNTWYVSGAPRPVRNAQGGVMRLVKVQRGRVREVGIGDSRLARGDRKQLKRYLKTWQTLGF